MTYFNVQNVNPVRAGAAAVGSEIVQGTPVSVVAGKVVKATGSAPILGVALRGAAEGEIVEYANDGVIGVAGVTAAVGEDHVVGDYVVGTVLFKSGGPLSIVKLAIAKAAS